MSQTRKTDLSGIELSFIEDKQIAEQTSEETINLLKEAIDSTDYGLIEKIISGETASNTMSRMEYIDSVNERTLFGYAVFGKFDERVVTLLASKGYDVLSYSECADFVSDMVRSYNPFDLSEFNVYLSRLKVILSVCRRNTVQKTLRNFLYSESRISEALNSLMWLQNHFKYGYGLVTFKEVNKAYMEMAEGRWSEAVNTISLLEDDEVDEKVHDIYPPDDDVASWTLLSYAVSKSRPDVVKLLIRKKADVNLHSERMCEGRLVKFTPFELAVDLNLLECCQILSENGANLYLQSSNPIGNILEKAILHENMSLIRLILKHRLYSDEYIQECLDDKICKIRDKNLRTEMAECLRIYMWLHQTKSNRIIKAMLMIKESTEPEVLKFIGELSLSELEEQIYPDTGCYLDSSLQQRRCLYSWKPGFTSLLTCATQFNKLKIVKTLLERGCSVNKPEDGVVVGCLTCKSALCIAAERNYTDILKLLLKWGARVENKYENNHPIFIFQYVLRHRNQEILETLVQRLDDPCRIFDEFDEHANYSSVRRYSEACEDVKNTFSVELLSFIFNKSRVSRRIWLKLVRRYLHGSHLTLYLLLNYLPCAPAELHPSLRELRGHRKTLRKRTDWLFETAYRCPSLQSVCRFVIRQAVQPYTQNNLKALGLPVPIEEYLQEHPMKDFMSDLQNADPRFMPVV